jgi:hypothetical protein
VVASLRNLNKALILVGTGHQKATWQNSVGQSQVVEFDEILREHFFCHAAPKSGKVLNKTT